jgi:predicted outer membrane protein
MNVNWFKRGACIASLLFSIAACNTDGDTMSGSKSREEDFVIDVLEENAEQRAWLKEAMDSATDPELKSAARDMMTEHDKMWSDLNAYADKKNFSRDSMDIAEKVDLNERRGLEWDEEWADEIGDKHRQLIRRFVRAQKRVEDTELRDMIARDLPVLRSHLDRVKKIEDRLEDNIRPVNEDINPILPK